MDHPIPPESLERFVRGASSREENRLIVAHLLSGCTHCARRIGSRVLGMSDPEPPGSGAAFDPPVKWLARAGPVQPRTALPPPLRPL